MLQKGISYFGLVAVTAFLAMINLVSCCHPRTKYDSRLCFYRSVCLLIEEGHPLSLVLSGGGGGKGSYPLVLSLVLCQVLPGVGVARTRGYPPSLDRRASTVTPRAVSLLQSRKRTFLLFLVYNQIKVEPKNYRRKMKQWCFITDLVRSTRGGNSFTLLVCSHPPTPVNWWNTW